MIRTEVRQVLVPAVVTDRHGHHVQGLHASDFQITEDGNPQQIVALGTESTAPVPLSIDLAGNASAGAARAKTPVNSNAPRMTYLILVDTLHSSFANFGRVRDALGSFFEKEQPADAQYVVLALGRELQMVQDSTRDRSAVLSAVRSKRFANMIMGSEAANLAESTNQFTGLMRGYCSVCACESAGRTSDLPGCNSAKQRVQAFLTSFGERTFVANQAFLRQLNEIVKAAAAMPTSRTVIFISDGFNRYAGRELYAILLGYAPKDRSFQVDARDTQPLIEPLLRLATKSDVRFYTLDSRGLYTVNSVAGSGFDASSSASSGNTQVDGRESANLAAGVPEAVTSRTVSAARENTDVLSELAHQTGGLFFENNNDMLKGLRQAVDDGREYYVLAYVPKDKTADGTYRKIVVTVKDPKWRVNAKAGYWAEPAPR